MLPVDLGRAGELRPDPRTVEQDRPGRVTPRPKLGEHGQQRGDAASRADQDVSSLVVRVQPEEAAGGAHVHAGSDAQFEEARRE